MNEASGGGVFQRSDIGPLILVTVFLLLMLLGALVLLMISVRNRRNRHRAELAELRLTRDREVMQAEREAQQQTLQEIGRELHDNLGQVLTVAQMGLDGVLAEGQEDRRLHEVMHTIELGIDEVRRMGRSLNSDMWVDRTFPEAVSTEADRIERSGIAVVHVLVEGEWPDLSPDKKTILFRTFQEVMNNALKHAEATAIQVTLTDGPPVTITVSDNGQGFDPAHPRNGNGLINIQRRCQLIGFRAEVSTAPGQGCTWRFTHDPSPHAP